MTRSAWSRVVLGTVALVVVLLNLLGSPQRGGAQDDVGDPVYVLRITGTIDLGSELGLTQGVQKLFYLPEVHTDFVFAVIAEEGGFLGCLTVIGLFVFLIWRIFYVGGQAERALAVRLHLELGPQIAGAADLQALGIGRGGGRHQRRRCVRGRAHLRRHPRGVRRTR